MTKNIYFDDDTWELFESLRKRRGLSRGAFIRELLFAFLRAEGGHTHATE